MFCFVLFCFVPFAQQKIATVFSFVLVVRHCVGSAVYGPVHEINLARNWEALGERQRVRKRGCCNGSTSS